MRRAIRVESRSNPRLAPEAPLALLAVALTALIGCGTVVVHSGSGEDEKEPECHGPADCEDDFACVDGECVAEHDDRCVDDEGCPEGMVCDTETGGCELDERHECEPGEASCVDDVTLAVCDEDGRGWLTEVCEVGCHEDTCLVCIPKEPSCDGDVARECDADGLGWRALEDCADEAMICLDGACLLCAPGARRCDDVLTLDTCAEDGASWTSERCEIACEAGACLACEPGEAVCEDATAFRCDETGMVLEQEDCGSPELCDDGRCGICVPDERRCTTGRGFEVCAADAMSWVEYEHERGLCVDEPMEGEPGRAPHCQAQQDCFACHGCRSEHAEVCVEGSCWLSGLPDPDSTEQPLLGSFNVNVELPRTVDSSRLRSAAIRVLHPRRSDGSWLTCEQLLSYALESDQDQTLNLLRKLEPPVNLPVGADLVSLGAGHIAAGEERLFLVRMHTSPNGGGSFPLAGCTEGVTVTPGDGQEVTVTTHRQ